MGYKRKGNTFTLVFDDSEYAGLEIEAKSLAFGDFLDVSTRFSKADLTGDDISSVLAAFANSLVRWNLEDDSDQPVPATVEGVRSLDLPFILAVVSAWINGIAGTPGDLGKDSPSGDNSPEASMQMADL